MGAQEQLVVMAIKGAISELSHDERVAVAECHEKLKALVAEYDDKGTLAVALLGAEMQAEAGA